jgi:hypothetical protein
MRWIITAFIAICFAASSFTQEKPARVVQIDKDKRTVTVPCTIAPRKIDDPSYKEIYPIEVIACWPWHKDPALRGQKSHEAVVVFERTLKPSDVHKALEQFGLKPGKPAKGENTRAEGPEVTLSLLLPGIAGSPREVPIEKTLVDRKTGKPLPPLKWHFTGSAMKQPDPEKADKIYGADFTGTLIAIFPVTDETVLQSNLTMKEEPLIKLETNKTGDNALPKEGTAVKLVIKVK